MPSILVCGNVCNELYHEIILILEDLIQIDNHLSLEKKPLMPLPFLHYLKEKRMYSTNNNKFAVIFHSIEGYIGGIDELLIWAAKTYQYKDDIRQHDGYQAIHYQMKLTAQKHINLYVKQQLKDFPSRKFITLYLKYDII